MRRSPLTVIRPLMFILCLAPVALVPLRAISAQMPSTSSADTSRARLEPLKWMIGEWEGPATGSMGGRSFTLTQRETVIEAANGTVLLVRGRGSIATGGNAEREVFQAAGLLTYDVGMSRFTWVSSGGTGHLGVTEAVVKGSTLIWSMKDRTGKETRYTITPTAAGAWHEIGEELQNGSNWTKVFEMTVSKR